MLSARAMHWGRYPEIDPETKMATVFCWTDEGEVDAPVDLVAARIHDGVVTGMVLGEQPRMVISLPLHRVIAMHWKPAP